MASVFQPMPLKRHPEPFDHPEWIFELKYDGFRALAVIEQGGCRLISRNGNPFSAFTDLAADIASSLSASTAVLDGEIVCLDRKGRPQFTNLLFHRGAPLFFAFDILAIGRNDWRSEPLIDRKLELGRLLSPLPPSCRIRYVEHLDGQGSALFKKVCDMDLEGIVAKQKNAPYTADPERTTWIKIRNRRYSQMVGREELFDRERHREPAPGWHTCDIACVEVSRFH